MGGCVMGGCVSFFFQLQKKEINDKGGLCQVQRNVRRVLLSFVMKRDDGGWVGQKRVILA